MTNSDLEDNEGVCMRLFCPSTKTLRLVSTEFTYFVKCKSSKDVFLDDFGCKPNLLKKQYAIMFNNTNSKSVFLKEVEF